MSHERHLIVALYEGETVGEARIVAASTNPDLVKAAMAVMMPERIGRVRRPATRKRPSRIALQRRYRSEYE